MFRVPGYPKTAGNQDIQKSGYPEIRISGISDFRISGFPDIQNPGFPDIRKPGFPDIRYLGFPESRMFGTIILAGTIISGHIVDYNRNTERNNYIGPYCRILGHKVCRNPSINTRWSDSADRSSSSRSLVHQTWGWAEDPRYHVLSTAAHNSSVFSASRAQTCWNTTHVATEVMQSGDPDIQEC